MGVGEPRSVPCEALADILWWQFRPDGLALIILGNEFRQPRRLYEFTLDGSGSVRALTASPINWPFVLSHDGLMVAAVDPSDRLVLIDLGTGEANPAPMPVLISADGATYAYGYRRSLSDLFLLRGLA